MKNGSVLNASASGYSHKWRNSMRPGEECPYITRCGWCCKFDAPCKDVVEDSKKREAKKEVKSDE